MIVYRQRWCLWNGWKCMHDTIHCMEYWTIASCEKTRGENIWLSPKTMMSWSVVSHCPLHPLHRFLANNSIVELPDKVFNNLTSLTYLWVHVCMNDGVSYYFMHWSITSNLNFVIILLNETTISWWALLIALVYQCAELLPITTPPNSITTYSPTWHLGSL